MNGHFLGVQGQHVPKTTIYQDNRGTILLAENGMTSSSKRTHHINICYFFVADKIKKGEVPHHKNTRRFLHKAPTGQHFQKDAKRNIESARHQ